MPQVSKQKAQSGRDSAPNSSQHFGRDEVSFAFEGRQNHASGAGANKHVTRDRKTKASAAKTPKN